MATALPKLKEPQRLRRDCGLSSSISGFTTPSATEVIHPDLARLIQNRQETESVRQGWYAMQRSRKGSRYQQVPDYVQNLSESVFRSFPRYHGPHGPESIASEKYYTALTHPKVTSWVKQKRSKGDRELSTPKYYTSMTIRPPKSSGSPKFNALNRRIYGSIPNWFDSPHVGEFPKTSMEFWHNEVNKKPELNRPPPYIYLPHPTPNPDLEKLRYRPPKNTTMFYKSNPPVAHKHYMVCPEWPSERLNRSADDD